MQIVIEIPKQAYDLLQNEGVDWLGAEHILDAVSKGILLPEQHGRLIDIDNINEITLEDSLHILSHTKGDEIDCYIDAPTIIPATKKEKLSCDNCKHKNKKYKKFPCIDCLEKDRYEEVSK